MRVSRFLLIAVVVTSFSLLYVWQQTEIFRLAYAGQKSLTHLEDLLDKNTVLRYNIGRGSSLVTIGNKVSAAKAFQMPDTYRLVQVSAPAGKVTVAKQSSRRVGIAYRFFGIKRQAEAKTINP